MSVLIYNVDNDFVKGLILNIIIFLPREPAYAYARTFRPVIMPVIQICYTFVIFQKYIDSFRVLFQYKLFTSKTTVIFDLWFSMSFLDNAGRV